MTISSMNGFRKDIHFFEKNLLFTENVIYLVIDCDRNAGIGSSQYYRIKGGI